MRELRNVMERAVLLCGGGPVLPVHLPLDKMRATVRVAVARPIVTGGGRRAAAPRADDFVDASPTLVPLRDGVVEYERRRIVEVLALCQWNQTQAARLLGISRMTLASRMESSGSRDREIQGVNQYQSPDTGCPSALQYRHSPTFCPTS